MKKLLATQRLFHKETAPASERALATKKGASPKTRARKMKMTLKAVIIVAAVTASHFALCRITSIPLQLVVGLLLGVFLTSLHESLVHQYLGHAKTGTREFWLRHPRVFLSLIEGFWLHHVVHHGKTFRDGYLVQFGEGLDMKAVDEWGPEAFYRLFKEKDQAYVRKTLPPAKIVAHMHSADYGLGADSVIAFASTVLLLVCVVFALVPFWMALSAALPMLFVYPAMSNVIHRNIMHIPQDGSVRVVRNETSVNWFVGTAYMKALERWHWMHHEYIYCNYNLLVLADFFRGARRKPSAEDREKMEKEGLVMETWSWSNRLRLRRV